jgi:hypothetical protein
LYRRFRSAACARLRAANSSGVRLSFGGMRADSGIDDFHRPASPSGDSGFPRDLGTVSLQPSKAASGLLGYAWAKVRRCGLQPEFITLRIAAIGQHPDRASTIAVRIDQKQENCWLMRWAQGVVFYLCPLSR